jgi:integrase
MARPKLDTPNYRLVRRGSRFYVRGAWQRVSTGTSDQRQAQIFLAQFLAGQGTPAPPKAPTVAVILDAYLADRKQAVVPAGYLTLRTNAKALNRHLADLEPEHLTKERIRFYRRQRVTEGYEVGPPGKRRKKPVQDGTILRELVTLRAALHFAETEKWIKETPYIVVPSQPKPRDRWLTRDEADRLLASAQALHVKTFLAVCLYTASRASAVLQLKWDRVDLAGGMIDFGSVEGGKGRAIVPIADSLKPYLAEARKAATCPFVIEHGGEPVGSVKTGVRAAARRAEVSGVSPHVLRHTAATWMAMKGIPIEQIARMLGHTDPRVTWRTYAKYSPDYLRDAVAALSG